MSVTALIVAAGRGIRAAGPKSMVPKLRGRSVRDATFALERVGLILGSMFFGGGSVSGKQRGAGFEEIGNSAYDEGAPKTAILAYTKALQVDPRNPDVLTDAGAMYLQTGDVNGAIARFREAIAADPNHPKSWFHLGTALMHQKGKLKEASDAFRECLRIAPNGEVAPEARRRLQMIEKLMKHK